MSVIEPQIQSSIVHELIVETELQLIIYKYNQCISFIIPVFPIHLISKHIKI